MRLRDWFRDHPPSGTPPVREPADQLSRARDASRALLSAGEAAINRALSSNSEQFLAATRQQGGQ